VLEAVLFDRGDTLMRRSRLERDRPAATPHRDLADLGVAALLDASVFSSEVGRCEPHAAIFECALERAGADSGRPDGSPASAF